MDASPDVLAETVRAKRTAVDNDLELLRVQPSKADSQRRFGASFAAKTALPVAAGTAALWLWRRRRRRRVNSLNQLLVRGMIDLYQIEHQLLPALDQMCAQASNEELQNAFAQHRKETEAHIDRLERAFKAVGASPKSGSSAAVAAIITDGERLTKNANRDVCDAWLIATAQRIEHLEIANYGTVRTYAETLGFTPAAQLLQQTLEEERATDLKLTHLAERFVNPLSIRTSRVM
jgi:ferritin-like metal-binding protein YciE